MWYNYKSHNLIEFRRAVDLRNYILLMVLWTLKNAYELRKMTLFNFISWTVSYACNRIVH